MLYNSGNSLTVSSGVNHLLWIDDSQIYHSGQAAPLNSNLHSQLWLCISCWRSYRYLRQSLSKADLFVLLLKRFCLQSPWMVALSNKWFKPNLRNHPQYSLSLSNRSVHHPSFSVSSLWPLLCIPNLFSCPISKSSNQLFLF